MVRRLPARLRVLGSYAACLLLLAACGGGGGTPPMEMDDDPMDMTPVPTNISFLQADEAGFRRNISIAGTITNDGFAITGDDVADVGVRAVMRFAPSVAALPDGVTIVKVELRLPQTTVVGAPHTELGPVEAMLVDLGPAVNWPDDFDSPSIEVFGPLATDATLEMKVLDITTQIKTLFDAGTRVFDVRLQNPGLSNSEQMVDRSDFNDPANLPTGTSLGGLFIEYTPLP